MAYIRQTGARPLSPETVQALAEAVGLALPPEDIDPLVIALTDQLASIAQLDQLDLTNVDPAVRFDPRWGDGDAS